MVYVGMDIHKNYSSVAVIDEQGALVGRRRVSHHYREELTGYFNQFPLKTQVVMEATCGWGWLSEVSQDLGLEVRLANPSKVRIIAERIERKKGASVATAAVAHHLLVIVYHLLKEQREYYSSKLRGNLSGRPALTLVARS